MQTQQIPLGMPKWTAGPLGALNLVEFRVPQNMGRWKQRWSFFRPNRGTKMYELGSGDLVADSILLLTNTS